MNKKTLATLCLVLVLSISLAVPAFAAGLDEVNAELQRLMEKYAGNAKFEKLVDDAQIWLNDPANADAITEEAAAAIIAEVQTAEATAGDITKRSDLSDAQLTTIISSISAAASEVGLTFEASANNTSFVLKDASGNEISSFTADSPVKQTGFTFDLTGLIIAAFVVVALVGFAVTGRGRAARQAA